MLPAQRAAVTELPPCHSIHGNRWLYPLQVLFPAVHTVVLLPCAAAPAGPFFTPHSQDVLHSRWPDVQRDPDG